MGRAKTAGPTDPTPEPAAKAAAGRRVFWRTAPTTPSPAGSVPASPASLRSKATAKRKATPKPKATAKPKAPATPQDRRRRIPVALAAVFALAVLATSFPLSSLLSQHHQLSAASAQLQQVQKENRALTEQQRVLDSNVAVTQLARGDYQLVSPGQTLYDVLPPSSKTGGKGTTGTTAPGSTVNGDPGDQPLVAPANAPDLSAQAALLPQPIPSSAAGSPPSAATATRAPASGGSTAPPAPTTFWGRVSQTLQFWK